MFQRTFRQARGQMGQKTAAIEIAEPLEYLLITVKLIALEKVCFSDTENP